MNAGDGVPGPPVQTPAAVAGMAVEAAGLLAAVMGEFMREVGRDGAAEAVETEANGVAAGGTALGASISVLECELSLSPPVDVAVGVPSAVDLVGVDAADPALEPGVKPWADCWCWNICCSFSFLATTSGFPPAISPAIKLFLFSCACKLAC